MMNDESIRVNIRTGTSTRRANRRIENIIPLFFLLYGFNEDEENKEPDVSIKLDIEKINCSEEHKNKNCSICYSKLGLNNNITILNCNHIFHYDCISTWGHYKQSCPLCRQNIPIIK